MNQLGLTWKDVLDSYKGGREGNDIFSYMEKVVKPSGYKYFQWNGKIYKFEMRVNWTTMTNYPAYSDTGIFAAELD